MRKGGVEIHLYHPPGSALDTYSEDTSLDHRKQHEQSVGSCIVVGSLC